MAKKIATTVSASTVAATIAADRAGKISLPEGDYTAKQLAKAVAPKRLRRQTREVLALGKELDALGPSYANALPLRDWIAARNKIVSKLNELGWDYDGNRIFRSYRDFGGNRHAALA
jgi:hypothetical protein